MATDKNNKTEVLNSQNLKLIYYQIITKYIILKSH